MGNARDSACKPIRADLRKMEKLEEVEAKLVKQAVQKENPSADDTTAPVPLETPGAPGTDGKEATGAQGDGAPEAEGKVAPEDGKVAPEDGKAGPPPPASSMLLPPELLVAMSA